MIRSQPFGIWRAFRFYLVVASLLLSATACQEKPRESGPPGGEKAATPPVASNPPPGDKALPAQCKESIQDRLKKNLKLTEASKIQIAPGKKEGTSVPGEWTAVNGNILDAIFKLIGIDPCKTDPKDLKGKPGFIEFIGDSGVLEKGGTRATFGFFIKVTQNGADAEYFALFSYDKITVKDGGKETVICATEFFLFGPLTRSKNGKVVLPPKLEKGLAIDKEGCLLDEVPLGLAKVHNWLTSHPEKEPVKPGVDKPPNETKGTDGEGCVLCHNGEGGAPPNDTHPFPWDGEKE